MTGSVDRGDAVPTDTGESSAPYALTVVIAATSSEQSIAEALEALTVGCAGITTEVLCVTDGTVPGAAHYGFPLRVLRCDASILTPVRWGIGARQARGRVIAFTTDHIRVDAGWGQHLLDAIRAGAVGAGGPIAIGTDANTTTTATRLIRFSAFLPGRTHERQAVPEIAGDNAAYERAAIERHTDLLRDGFWEVEFHRRFHAEGRWLAMVPNAVVALVGPIPFWPLVRQRYHHARAFGWSRVHRHAESAVGIVIRAPLVPIILCSRMLRRARVARVSSWQVLRCIPQLIILTTAWAAGEAVGAVTRPAPSP